MITPDLTFNEAWPLWYREKAQTISKRSQSAYRDYRKALAKLFGPLKLSEINIEHVIDYREQRSKNAGPMLINHEVCALAQILRRVELWDPIRKHYRQLRVPKSQGVGLRLTPAELAHLAEVASRKYRWRVAYLASMIQTQTAAGPTEVLSIRLRDIDWGAKRLHIPGTKTDSRPREVPMTEDCFLVLKEAEQRAREKGSVRPEHYLFPHQRRGPEERAATYWLAWDKLRKEAAKKFPRLATARRYDLRHTAISVMAENPAIDEATLKKVIGHGPGSKLIMEVYFHERDKRKAEAVSVLNGITRPRAKALFEDAKRPPRTLPLRTEETDPLEVLQAALDEEAG